MVNRPTRFIFPKSIDDQKLRYGSEDFQYFVEVGVGGTDLGRIFNMSPSAIFHTWLPAYRKWEKENKEKQKNASRYNTTKNN